MNRTALILALVALVGCSTVRPAPEFKNVNLALAAWKDYVESGASTPEDQARVRAAYANYQAAVRIARGLLSAPPAFPGELQDVDSAIDRIKAAGDPLVDLINSLTRPQK